MAIDPISAKQKMTPAVLSAVERLPGAPDLAVFTLQPKEGGQVPPFKAGQYTTVAVDYEGEFAIRYYSIASAPERRDAFEFYVVRIAGQTFTPELFNLRVGETLWYGEPAGGFTLERSDRRHLAFVASGTGIAPFVAMLRHLRAAGAGTPVPQSVTLWHGVRHAADLGYRAEMEEAERSAPFPFRYLPAVSRWKDDPGFDDSRLGRGRVNHILARTLGLPVPAGAEAFLPGRTAAGSLRAMLPGGATAIFLCGNPGMIQDFEACAQGSAWREHLVFEKYW